jgi:outer membrane protein W
MTLMLLVICPVSTFAMDTGGTDVPGFGIGPRGGFYDARDGDEGTFTGGLQARMRVLPFLAVEGSVDYHQSNFDDGAIEVRTYPLMVSGLLYVFPNPAFSPYLLAGVGWHFQDIEFEAGGTERSNQFGGQAGAGFDVPLGTRTTLNADVRYIFLDFDDDVETQAGEALSADSLAGTVGLTFYF